MRLRLKEIVIILFIMFTLSMIAIVTKSRSNATSKKIDVVEAIIVDNSTDFYDISGIVDKYINALMNRNTNNLMLMLDKKYIITNHITERNIYKFTGDLSDNIYTFSPIKMYYYEINDNQSKFYVYGHLEIEQMDYSTDYKDFYIVVIKDQEKEIFSIIPDNGDLFKEVES